MARSKSVNYIHFGPPIPVVPVKDFSNIGLNKQLLEDVWAIVGPSVGYNMSRGVEMWKVITAAYLEGLNHGMGLEQERMKVGRKEKSMAKVQIVLTEAEVDDILKDRIRQTFNIPARAVITINWNDDSGLTATLDDMRDSAKEPYVPLFGTEAD